MHARSFQSLRGFLVPAILFIFFLVLPAHALILPPDPFDITERHALLVQAADGAVIGVTAKVQAPEGNTLSSGQLRALVSYTLPPSSGVKSHRSSVSAAASIPGLNSTAILIAFDLTADPIPVEARRRTLEIFYQQTPDAIPVLIAEYRPEQLIPRPSGDAVRTTLSPEATARNGLLIAGPVTILREREKPKAEQIAFTVPDTAGTYFLRLANGTPAGTHRVASAVVQLNGQEVFRPSEFNQKVAGLIRQVVPIKGENILEVRLRSAPGAHLTLELVKLDGTECRALGPRTFLRATGKPKIETVTFSLSPQLTGPYTLRVTNGNLDGSRRADSALITLNGQEILSSSSLNEQVAAITSAVTLQPNNTLSVELAGAPGDTLTLEITGYDTTPPRAFITSPGSGSIVSESPVTVSGTVDDPYATVTVNGILATVSSEGIFTAEGIILQEGENPVTVIATDPCGNQGQDQIAVSLQTILPQGPELQLCAERFHEQVPQPPDAGCSQEAYSRYYGLVTGTVDETAVTVSLNGTPLPDGVEIENQGDIFWGMREGNFIWVFVNMLNGDGPYYYTVAATNAQGITTEVTVTIIKDTVPPAVVITSPPDRTVTSSDTVAITGIVDDLDATVWLGWSFIPLDPDGAFSVTAGLPLEGWNTLYVYARDLAYNSRYARRYIIRDTITPVLSITSPAEGTVVNTPALNVTGTIIDQNPESVTVSINGGPPQALTLAGTAVSGTVTLSNVNAANTLLIEAKDKAGNTSTMTRTVILDQEPPMVAITSPLPEAVLSGISTVSVQATDTLSGIAGVTLIADGQVQGPLTQPPFDFSLDTMTLSAGPHTLTAQVADASGNEAEASISVTVQSQLRAEITSPADGSTINRTNTIIKGRIYQNAAKEVGVTINGAIAHVHGDRFGAVIPLQQGVNTIVATATDVDGLTAETTITINADSPQENMRLTALPESGIMTTKTDGTTSFDATLEAEAYLRNDIAGYSWDTNGDGVADQTGPTLTAITAIYQAPGLYFPTVTVTDTLGYTYTETTIVYVLDRNEIDALLSAKWEGMKNGLVAGSIDKALKYFSASSQAEYTEIFGLLASQLPALASGMQEINMIGVSNSVAEYYIKRFQRNTDISYFIYFLKDEQGLWKIDKF